MSASTDRDRDAGLAQALHTYLSAAGPGGVLLAVSGGPDSTALLHAAASYGAGRGLHVATVDHRLRPEARDEAVAVERLASRLGLPHRILVWEHPAQRAGFSAAARAARYRLLADHAEAIGAGTLLTAHTADDQAETVLMRLIAGSGPAGLAGMRRERVLTERLALARPFLHLHKADLVAYCERHRLAFARDPSNADPRFARPRLRTVLPLLAGEGLTPERLCRLADRAARDDAALAVVAAALFERVVQVGDGGGVTLDGARLAREPVALVLRVIDHALGLVEARNAASGHPRLERLERLVLDDLLPALAEERGLRRTLRGVLVALSASGRLRLSPAPPRRYPRRDGLVAGVPDLLGKGVAAAYIGSERVE